MKEIITVASGKGGVGKSTLCVHIANQLTALGNKVLLIDFDIGLRCLDTIMGVSDNILYDWGDVINDICDFDEAVIEKENMFLLPAPRKSSENINAKAVRSMIELATNSFDYIICDSSAGVGEAFELACSASSYAIIVSTPDTISANAAANANEKAIEMGIRKTRLIINRFSYNELKKGRALNIDDMIDLAGIQLLGVVPFEEKFARLNGQNFNKNNSLSAIQAIARISGRIDGKEISLKNLEKM
ncbi:MAG: P-loop NTPase [Clostridiales bacterium]|nr:P-loop NTPase [Clostridiales bacterium]